MRTAEGFATLAASGPTAPRTFLNREIGRDRRVAYVDAELAELKAMRGSSGATVNDVILSVAAGGLRRLFDRRGEPVPMQLVALVPMSIRRPGEDLELGNRIATLLVRLPIGEGDPRGRLAAIHAETTRLKASEQATRGVADHRGDRLDAADDQPRARRGDRAPARVQPRRLQRARAADALLPAGQPARGRSIRSSRCRRSITRSRSGS